MLAKTMLAGISVVAVIVSAVGVSSAGNAADSTTRQRLDTFGWQPPNARMLNNKAESQLDVNSANSANSAAYATGSGSANYATNSGTAAYVPSTGVTGVPSCASGYVLQKTASGFLCVNSIASSDNSAYATSAGNGVSGISDSNLNLSNGSSYTLPSGGGGGGGKTGACSEGSDFEGNPAYTSCWGTATTFDGWHGYCTSGTMTGCSAVEGSYWIVSLGLV